jgi:hypothetical protein
VEVSGILTHENGDEFVVLESDRKKKRKKEGDEDEFAEPVSPQQVKFFQLQLLFCIILFPFYFLFTF